MGTSTLTGNIERHASDDSRSDRLTEGVNSAACRCDGVTCECAKSVSQVGASRAALGVCVTVLCEISHTTVFSV